MIERAVIVARGGVVEFDLPVSVKTSTVAARQSVQPKSEPEFLTEPEMLRRERDNLLIVLEKADWKIKGMDGAAELLGVKPTTLLSRIKKMGLRRDAMAENSTRED